MYKLVRTREYNSLQKLNVFYSSLYYKTFVNAIAIACKTHEQAYEIQANRRVKKFVITTYVHQTLEDIKVKSECYEAWNMQSWDVFSMPRNFRTAGDGAAAYVTKYCAKQSQYRLTHHLPPEYPAPKIYMSNRHGGIGRPFIERFRDYMVANPTVDRLEWTSKHDGKIHWCRVGSYIKQVLHPSPSRQVPAPVKQAYRELCDDFVTGVLDGVLPADYARFMASRLRPPHLPNLLPTLPRSSPRCPCMLYRLWKSHLLWRALEELNVKLSFHLENPVPVKLKEYYDYMRVQKKSVDNRGNLAGDKLRSLMEQSVLESKSRL